MTENLERFRIVLDTVTQKDELFLLALYSETRQEEIILLPWNEEQKKSFLLNQFQSQHQHYISKYPDGFFQVIKLNEKPIGRLYFAELEDEIRIIDITISNEFRRKHIGTTLIHQILQDADKKNKDVRIYLEMNTKSTGLFTRLGFTLKVDEGFYQLWQKRAKGNSNKAKA